ncbi:MAG: TetR/AcrR family transcriptional regulator [Rhodobacteraceae bacterium]|nr:TetR/AcrR family transcriptional regulator [Paracoccaceae bacterium]
MSKKDYHHGDLKNALKQATLDLVEEFGPQAFTLAAAAKRVGVSPAAPYRHFKSKEELLQMVAIEGFKNFRAMLNDAYQKKKSNPREAFRATGKAYLEFAKKFPGHYIIMFESGISLRDHPELSIQAKSAKEVIQKALNRITDLNMKPDLPPVTLICDHIWALSHGVVELYGRKSFDASSTIEPEQILESGVGYYLRGLGLFSK